MANVCPLRLVASTIALNKNIDDLDNQAIACIEGHCMWFNETRAQPDKYTCAIKTMADDLEVVATRLQVALIQKLDDLK